MPENIIFERNYWIFKIGCLQILQDEVDLIPDLDEVDLIQIGCLQTSFSDAFLQDEVDLIPDLKILPKVEKNRLFIWAETFKNEVFSPP